MFLFDVRANLCEELLHSVFVFGVDDGDDFFHFGTDLLHLVFGVRVEQNLAQQSVVFAEYTLGYLHVALERGAWCVLVFQNFLKIWEKYMR